MKRVYFFILTLIINSCSSLNKDECRKTDWYKLGKKDALAGQISPKHQSYKKECSEFEMKIDEKKYLEGYDNGLLKYCTYFQGLSRGEGGLDRHISCDKKSEKFVEGYDLGRDEYLRKKDLEQTKAKLLKKYEGRECKTKADCMMPGQCEYGRCQRSGGRCVFDSDCDYIGRCEEVSEWTGHNDNVIINVCKHKMIRY